MAQKPVTTENGEEVVFRRIRGRVVPIKRKKGSSPATTPKRKKYSKDERAKKATVGSGLVFASAISGAFGGSVFSEFGDEAKRSREVSKGFQTRSGFINSQIDWLKQKQRIKKKQGKDFAAVYSKRTGIFTDDIEFLKKQKKTFRRAGARARMRSQRLSKTGFIVGGAALSLGAFGAAAGSRRLYEAGTGREANVAEEAFTDVGSSIAFAAAANEYGLKQKKSFRAAKTILRKIISRGKL